MFCLNHHCTNFRLWLLHSPVISWKDCYLIFGTALFTLMYILIRRSQVYHFIYISIYALNATKYKQSEFNLKDFSDPDNSLQDKLKIAKSCFYQGHRYPPNHPLKYQHREDYWFNLAIKFLIVVIFEVSVTKCFSQRLLIPFFVI